MKIQLVTPAPPRSLKGNRITAVRWNGLLTELGHEVQVREELQLDDSDLLIALHARRSAVAIAKFARHYPARPCVLALTGTDLYRDIGRSAAATRSLGLADRLVLLQPNGRDQLPANLVDKTRVIYQSVLPLAEPPQPLRRVFEVTVVGHLRSVKDPFRTAYAVRDLPAASRIRVSHYGAPLSDQMRQRAERETERNDRYVWYGPKSRGRVLRCLARSRVLVLSSKMEGGANAISEAVVMGVPIIGSRISGTTGLLGEDYPGLFEVGDTRGLRDLLLRFEVDKKFQQELATRCARQQSLFTPAREKRSWKELLGELVN